MKLNGHYRNLQDSYLFSTIAHKVAAYQQAHPDAPVIRLGIGDVTRPLCPAVVSAMRKAVTEMGEAATFRGYGPEQGYGFLRGAVGEYYRDRGIAVEDDEIFISDGAKSDLGNILDLFDRENTVLIPDPVYPVYVDTNLMAGRPIVYMEAGEDNGFLPLPDPAVKADIIYLCSPNNPTGAVYGRDGLRQWVEYALENEAVILFDAAYEAFISGADLPRSIYEIEGARRCAIEFCSFSKTAGFTGTRCGYTVVPWISSPAGCGCGTCGCAGRRPSSTGCPTSCRRGRRRCSPRKAGSRCRRVSAITARTRGLSPRRCGNWGSGSPAGRIRLTCG